MISYQLIDNKSISDRELNEVIKVKQLSWPYTTESHLEWIKQNLKSSDLHFLLYQQDNLLAYINLVDINILIDDKEYIAYGIGNVCTAEKGLGWGGKMMDNVTCFLKKENRAGLLFCKESLLKFYSKYGWETIPSNKIIQPKLNDNVYTMTFGVSCKHNFIYEGILF
jgi:hypothetical protein